MSEPPDEPPPSAASDPLLSLQARTPGPRGGMAGKLALAALALLILVGLVVALRMAGAIGQKPPLQRPATEFQPRHSTSEPGP